MSEETTALIPIEERQVSFYGDDITATLVEINNQEQIFVPLRPICEYLGLNWSAQLQRTRRDEVLAESLVSVFITHTEIPGVGKGGRDVICLSLEQLPGWLMGVSANRVKPELKEKILRYRRECFRVLWQAFQGEASLDRTGPAPSAGLLQIRDMGLAIVKMAEEQIELEHNVNRAHTRLDQAALAFKNLDQRLTSVEKKLIPTGLITDEQASEVSQAVKALADYLTTKDKSKNHYQSVFQEIYRRFGVSSYKNIRADKFAAVLKFLADWKDQADK